MRFFLIFLSIILSGCASTERITDFSDLSTVYGWVEMDRRAGNHLYSVLMRQYRPLSDKPFYGMLIEEMDGGFVFFHHGFKKGSYKLDKAYAQSCLGIICNGTRFEYIFGRQGDSAGAIIIDQPGTYHLGNFRLERLRTGFFEQGKFEIEKIEGGPSKREILEFLASKTPEKFPQLIQRMKSASTK